jgi:hypothetical protein
LPEALYRLGQTSGSHSLTFEDKRSQLLQDRAAYNLNPQRGEKSWYVAELEFLTPELAPVSYRTFSVRSVAPNKAKASVGTQSIASGSVRQG